MENTLSRLVAALGCTLSVAAMQDVPATAAQTPTTAVMDVHVSSSGTSLAPVPGMVSFVRGGEIVAQKELVLQTGTAHMFGMQLPVGSYDIRVEAEGLVTEVKRGARVIAGQKADLQFFVRPGKGVHTIEYAEGGLAREEVAARLSAVEASVAELHRDPTAIAVSASAQTSDMRTTGTVKWFEAPRVVITAIDSKTGLVTARDPATKQQIQFRASTPIVARLTVGQKVWANFDARQVSVDGADPSCTMVGSATRP